MHLINQITFDTSSCQTSFSLRRSFYCKGREGPKFKKGRNTGSVQGCSWWYFQVYVTRPLDIWVISLQYKHFSCIFYCQHSIDLEHEIRIKESTQVVTLKAMTFLWYVIWQCLGKYVFTLVSIVMNAQSVSVLLLKHELKFFINWRCKSYSQTYFILWHVCSYNNVITMKINFF